MHTEPAINRPALLAAVREQYQVTLDSLTFVPLGFAAACYTARRRTAAAADQRAAGDTAVAATRPIWVEVPAVLAARCRKTSEP